MTLSKGVFLSLGQKVNAFHSIGKEPSGITEEYMVISIFTLI